jgi:hypothetical protein
VLQQCGIFLCFYIFSDWFRKVIQQCGIFCFSTGFLFGLGRCSNSVVFFVCKNTKNTSLLKPLPNPIRKNVEKQKIPHCWSTFLIQSEKM